MNLSCAQKQPNNLKHTWGCWSCSNHAPCSCRLALALSCNFRSSCRVSGAICVGQAKQSNIYLFRDEQPLHHDFNTQESTPCCTIPLNFLSEQALLVNPLNMPPLVRCWRNHLNWANPSFKLRHFVSLVGVGAIMVGMTLVSIPLMDRAGRRTLHLWGLGGMFIFSIFITISLLVMVSRKNDLYSLHDWSCISLEWLQLYKIWFKWNEIASL